MALVECTPKSQARRTQLLGAAGTLIAMTAVFGCGSEADIVVDTDSVPTQQASDSASTAVSTADSTADVEYVELGGFALPVPDGWTAHREAVIGTELQSSESSCIAVEARDSDVASESGSPSADQAVVQLCAVPLADELGLEEWLVARGQPTWTSTSFGTCDVLELPGDEVRRLAYTQDDERRVEIAIVVATTPEMTEQRAHEAQRLVEEMRCPTE